MRLASHRSGSGLLRLAVATLACLALAGCGTSHRRTNAGPAITVTEHDFHIDAPATLAAGEYTFDVDNDGSTDHELIVAPTTNGSLPLRADGLTVDEAALEAAEPGSLEPGSPGARRQLTVHLAPGRYVFFCNMEGHYMAGMHAEVVVE